MSPFDIPRRLVVPDVIACIRVDLGVWRLVPLGEIHLLNDFHYTFTPYMLQLLK